VICGPIVSVEFASGGQDVFVIDASALLRLFLADGPIPVGLETAMALGGRGDAVLLVPDLCLLESASVLLKQVQRSLLRRDEAEELFEDLRRLPLRPVPSSELSAHALALALDHGLSVYDAAYLALAQRSGAALITSDHQLESAARRCGCATLSSSP
jgi:predicted nucleic acid-binding protein